MYHPSLRAGAQRQLKKIKSADLVIGLPTYKNPESSSAVTRVTLEGVRTFYPDLRTVILNVDAGYSSETRRAILQRTDECRRNQWIVSGRYDGMLGRGNAIAAIFDAALALDAKAIVILDSDTQSITPNWIPGLAHLLLADKADLVMPRYQWSSLSSQAAFSDLIIHPLFRALWGRGVRHPAAPDFALSPRLAAAILEEDVWQTEIAMFGLSPWLVTHAVLEKFRVAQSAIGTKCNVSDLFAQNGHLKRQNAEFKAQFHDALSVLFRHLHTHRASWKTVDQFYSLSTLTEYKSTKLLTSMVERDLAALLDELALGWIEYRSIWQSVLSRDNLLQLEKLAALPLDRFYFPPNLWARILYDFAVVFNKGECDPYQVVTSLFPIYQGRTVAFWQEVAGLSIVGHEGTVAAQAVEFEEMRSYLKDRWINYQPWLHS